jgi:two-component system LytT family sensor kinase
MRWRSPTWFWIALLWLGIGLFDATQNVVVMRSVGMHHAWGYLYLTLLISWLPWMLATPIVAHLGQIYPPTRLKPLATWLIHLSAAAGVLLTYAAWRAVLEIAFNPWAQPSGPGSFTHLLKLQLCNGLLGTVFLYSSILAVSYLMESRQRLARQETETARLNEQLSKAQLQVLQQQIQPHFLFNTLNAITGLIREKRNEDAVSVIAGLSDLLRGVLEGSGKQQVPLREEVELLEKYIEIQRLRFSDRLQVDLDVPNELLAAQVPSFILQPLVENALKHGISKSAQGGDVQVCAARTNGTLILSVHNDGPGVSPGWEKNTCGIGISNLRTRLQSLYGQRSQFSLQNETPHGVRASVSLPFSSVEQ